MEKLSPCAPATINELHHNVSRVEARHKLPDDFLIRLIWGNKLVYMVWYMAVVDLLGLWHVDQEVASVN